MDQIRRLAGEQRKRLVGGLLGAAEGSPWWRTLTPTQQREFRAKILDSVGVYHDFMLDVLKVTGDDVMVNGHALELIQQLHQRVERALKPRG